MAARETTAENQCAPDVVAELQKRRVWVHMLAITGIVLVSLLILSLIFALVGQLVAPAQSGAQAIAAILFSSIAFALSVLAFWAFVNLLQYANALSVLHFAATPENLLRSLKKLSAFWLYAGICVLSSVVVISVSVLWAYAAGLRFAYLLGR